MARRRQVRRVIALALVTIGALLALPAATSAFPSYRITQFSGAHYESPGLPVFGSTNTKDVFRLSTNIAEPRRHLPFPLEFYGREYSTVWVSRDGTLKFGTGFGFGGPPFNDQDEPLPTFAFGGTPITGVVAVYWGPLDWNVAGQPPGSIAIKTLGNAPTRRFIVTWTAYYRGGPVNAQAVFQEESGKIAYVYGANTTGIDHTIGIQRGPRGPATMWSHNTASVSPGTRLNLIPVEVVDSRAGGR
jgi:hypothetical protein